MSASEETVKEEKPKTFEAVLTYSHQAGLEVMDNDTFSRRKQALEKAGFNVHSVSLGDAQLVAVLPGENEVIGQASEVVTPTQEELDEAAKQEAEAKAQAEAEAESATETTEEEPVP